MLRELHIKNVVLIKNISIIFQRGFSVFTGETGAGKSILLDSLAMALGERANYAMIGNYGENAEITAIFDIEGHPVKEVLLENNIEFENEIIIRRHLSRDGKSKAFINDTAVMITFLRKVGSMLLDIHGQFDNQRLLNASTHKEILDLFLEDKSLAKEVKNNYIDYKTSENNYQNKKQELIDLEKEKEFLEHSLNELEAIKPRRNEETELLDQKLVLNNAQRIIDNLDTLKKYLVSNNILGNMNKALKQIEPLRKLLSERDEINQIEKSLEQAYSSFESAIIEYEELENSLDFNEYDLKEIETRLMDIRTLAKKHRVPVDYLEDLQEDFKNKLNQLNSSAVEMGNLEEDLAKKQIIFSKSATLLSEQRQRAANSITNLINIELRWLKLENASFMVEIQEQEASESGIDKVNFKVKTNQGGSFGELQKVASGGEMARFMLAIKSVLAKEDIITTMILDEIDVGVGGEVALAIGSRLQELSKYIQLIVVTHSHQVASKGDYHYKVLKSFKDNMVETSILFLNEKQRIEEIARMISGDDINDIALANATSLLNKK